MNVVDMFLSTTTSIISTRATLSATEWIRGWDVTTERMVLAPESRLDVEYNE